MKLKEFLENYSDVLDLLDVPTVITDKNAKILYANPSALRNSKFTKRDVIGKNPSQLWGGHMSEEFYKKMWKTIKIDKKKFVSEIKNVTKEGREYWQEIHITPVLNKKDEVKYFIAVELPIEEKKEVESNLDVIWKGFITRETRIADLKSQIERLKLQIKS